jgi:molybdenum cofactor cytidylyltransferase
MKGNGDQSMKLGCVIMAAGNARRFGKNKLAAQLGGRSLFERVLETVPAELFEKAVVVTQYPEFDSIAKGFRFTVIRNPDPDLGISHTIALGLSVLQDCDGVMFLVSDQPLLERRSVADLVSLWQSQPDKIAALAHDGVRGNPCIFPARLFPELLALQGDRGGNAVIRQHEQELVLLEVPQRELIDVDTPAALRDLENGD